MRKNFTAFGTLYCPVLGLMLEFMSMIVVYFLYIGVCCCWQVLLGWLRNRTKIIHQSDGFCRQACRRALSVESSLSTGSTGVLACPHYCTRGSGCQVLWWVRLCVVCLSVCLFARISPKTHPRSLPTFLRMFPMSVAQSSSGRVTKSQRKRQFFWVFFPIDKALYSIAFGTHTKTAEPTGMPFGMMSGFGPRNSGGDKPQRGRGSFGGKRARQL